MNYHPDARWVLRQMLPKGYTGPDVSGAHPCTKPRSQLGLRQMLTKSDLFSMLKSSAKGKKKLQTVLSNFAA